MSPLDLTTLDDLTLNQRKFIQDNALEIFRDTMLPPHDYPEDIINSNCPCCQDRKAFMEKLLALG